MKKGDVVEFKGIVDPGDADLKMILLENPEKGRAGLSDMLVCLNTNTLGGKAGSREINIATLFFKYGRTKSKNLLTRL